MDVHIMACFKDLQNYTALKQKRARDITHRRFRDLQNYTTLKPKNEIYRRGYSFRGLQNYTTLKPQIKFEAQE